jgi:hypothetical protein
MELSEELEPEGWIARPMTRDTARGCHFHDALKTLLRWAFDRHTWSIEYCCVVYQHRRGLHPEQWEATCLVNLVVVLNTELDHALDELGKVRVEVAELRAECAARHYLDGGSPAPVRIQHPYHSPPRGRFNYGTPDCRTRIDLDP